MATKVRNIFHISFTNRLFFTPTPLGPLLSAPTKYC